MANIDATDTQKDDTPTAQHVCYGVHGGAMLEERPRNLRRGTLALSFLRQPF